ncbi:MAG: acyl-CoA dehydrogenase family protein [Lachnospirales bacterium]
MEFYNKAKEFALKNVSPIARELDREGVFPHDIFKKLGEENYFTLVIPKEYGGQGKNILEHTEICMALAESSSTVGLCYMMHNVALNVINTYGSDELKKEVFSKVVNEKKHLTLAYSEFGSGTHFYLPDTTVTKKDENYILNGTKSMVTSANTAAYYLVLSKSTNGDGITNWAVPAESKNLNFLHEHWDGLGMRANVSAPMEMKDLEISPKYMIGKDGGAMEHVLTAVAPLFIAGLAGVYSGLSMNVSDFAIKYSQERKYPTSQKLSEIETVQIHLANIYSKATAAKMITLDAARSGANGDADALAKILGARIIASETAIEVSNLGMRVGGGKAYNKKLLVDILLRDAYAGQIMAPSVDVLKIWLGKALTDQQIP